MNARQTSSLLLTLALATIALTTLTLALSIQSARAQNGDDIFVDKELGRVDPVVHVGEYLTFTILIRNDTAFTVTTLPLADTYNAAVLGYADAVPPPDIVDESAGQLDWADLTGFFGDLPPGREVLVVVGFIAEHPQTTVVNAADVHDAVGTGGALSGTTSIDDGTESIGGSSPVDKELLAGLPPRVGQPLTFTVIITNDGFTTMTVAPLIDTYNPAWLAFSYAVPPPDQIDASGGVLTWTDLTVWTGDVPAHASISVTTVFTALAATGDAMNHAEVVGASDWYGNDMGGGADDVPITIIGPTPTPAPTATPEQKRDKDKDKEKEKPTPTPVVLTPTPTATPEVPLLPETGDAGPPSDGRLFTILLGLGAASALLVTACRRTLFHRDSASE
jgi:hypothetical protein